MNNNNLNTIRVKLDNTWLMLKLTYGLLFVIAGADKFMNLVTHWGQYVSPHVLQLIPVTATQFIYGVGIIEIIIGAVILFFATRVGAYLAAAWLVLIVVNLLTMLTYFDIAVRDLVMAVGAIALGQLTTIKELWAQK